MRESVDWLWYWDNKLTWTQTWTGSSVISFRKRTWEIYDTRKNEVVCNFMIWVQDDIQDWFLSLTNEESDELHEALVFVWNKIFEVEDDIDYFKYIFSQEFSTLNVNQRFSRTFATFLYCSNDILIRFLLKKRLREMIKTNPDKTEYVSFQKYFDIILDSIHLQTKEHRIVAKYPYLWDYIINPMTSKYE